VGKDGHKLAGVFSEDHSAQFPKRSRREFVAGHATLLFPQVSIDGEDPHPEELPQSLALDVTLHAQPKHNRLHCTRYPPEYHPGMEGVSHKYHPDITRNVNSLGLHVAHVGLCLCSGERAQGLLTLG
jgi:hypothetical protein